MADYIVNTDAEELAEKLIADHHPHLIGTKIAHLMRLVPPKKNKPKVQSSRVKKITWAKASKVTPKMSAMAAQDFKFVIEYREDVWMALRDISTDKLRALVDHELYHCGVDGDGCYMKPHTVEEHREVIDRYGFWKDDVKLFADAVEVVILRGDGDQTGSNTLVAPEPEPEPTMIR